MQEKTADRLFGICFTGFIPVVVGLMLPHIQPTVGWPLIVGSAAIGIAALLHAGRRIAVLPMIIMGAAVIFFLGGAVWNYRTQQRSIASPTATPPATAPQPANSSPPNSMANLRVVHSLHETVDLQCDTLASLPVSVPPSGEINEVSPNWNDDNNDSRLIVGRHTFATPPGTPTNWPGPVNFASICKLTNYGPNPYDIHIPVSVTIKEAVAGPDGKSTREGKVLFSGEKILLIPKLDIGPEQNYTLYVLGLGRFMHIYFPEAFEARPLGSDNPTTIRFAKAAAGSREAIGSTMLTNTTE